MQKSIKVAALLSATLIAGAAQAAGPVYSTYAGSQLGVTERDAQLNQFSATGTGVTASGIAVTPDERIFITNGNNIHEVAKNVGIVNTMTFAPDPGVVYGGITSRGNQTFTTYSGSQLGVTIRDLNLVQSSFFDTGVNATDIAVHDSADLLYITAANSILSYDFDGNLVDSMFFPDSNILYTGIDFSNNLLFASYGGSQQGVTIRDLGLNQQFFFATPFTASGIAVGTNSLFLTSANSIYEYGFNGALLNTMTFPDQGILYTAIDYQPIGSGVVPEPATWALLIAGFGLVGGTLRRRTTVAVTA